MLQCYLFYISRYICFFMYKEYVYRLFQFIFTLTFRYFFFSLVCFMDLVNKGDSDYGVKQK